MAFAAPAAGRAAAAGAEKAAGRGGALAAAKKTGAGKTRAGVGPDDAAGLLPDRQTVRDRGTKKSSGKGKKALSGSAGKWRKVLIAEFIVCTVLLGLSPLARDDVSPMRFMKRGSATAAFFVVLGIISAFGRGAGRAAAAFGGLATVALLVDQREAFGKLATILTDTSGEDADKEQSSLAPDDSTSTDEGPGVAAV